MSDEEVVPEVPEEVAPEEPMSTEFNLEVLEPTPPDPEPEAPAGGLRLTMGVEEGAHVIVEIAGAVETTTYDLGEVESGMVDLKFPDPPEGDAILRVVTVDPEDGSRTSLHSETISGTA
jgi:hypothetical protein